MKDTLHSGKFSNTIQHSILIYLDWRASLAKVAASGLPFCQIGLFSVSAFVEPICEETDNHKKRIIYHERIASHTCISGGEV
jgi:hypothetical protein